MGKLLDRAAGELRDALGANDPLVKILEAKSRELGPYADEETESQILNDILQNALKGTMDDVLEDQDEEEESSSDSDIVLDENEKAYMREAKKTVRNFMDACKFHYDTEELRPDLYRFSMGGTIDDVRLRVRITVETNPRVCRVDAVLPFSGEDTYAYPLCTLLCKLNYNLRFGVFKYDERDGELLFEYSFRTVKGIDSDTLATIFHTVTNTAAKHCAEIRQYSVGRFKSGMVSEINDKVNKLVQDIQDD